MAIYWNRELDIRFDEYNKAVLNGDVILYNKIFNDYLAMPLKKLVESSLKNYSSHDYITESDTNIKYMLLGKIILIIHHYDINKGMPSFAYFGTVLKNEILTLNMKAYKLHKMSVSLDDTDSDDSYDDCNIIYADNRDLDRQILEENRNKYYQQLQFFQNTVSYTTSTEKKQIIDYVRECLIRPEVVDSVPTKHIKKFLRTKIKELVKLDGLPYTDTQIDNAFVKILETHTDIRKGRHKDSVIIKKRFDDYFGDIENV